MNHPADLKYSSEHEWVRVEGDTVVIGITEFAADQLGDIVYVDLPEAGAEVGQSAKFGEIESVKTVSDLFAPIDGRVAEVNDAVKDNPELVNSDAYGAGWLIKVAVADPSQLEKLMDVTAYKAHISA